MRGRDILIAGVQVLLPATLAVTVPAGAADLVVDGTTRVIEQDTVVAGSVLGENGGTLIVRNCTSTLALDYDEQHRIDVAGASKLVIDNAVITSTGGQCWMEPRSTATRST